MPANKNKSKLILVTGATGHQGGAALRHLSERGFSCRALTRDPANPKARRLVGSGIEVVRGDMDDPASLTRALDGVDGVYAVQTPYESGVEAETRQGINLIDAAKRSRITHFVYSSVGAADRRTGIPHFDSKFRIEEHLRGTGLRYTILRPVFFMENWLNMRNAIEGGALTLPLEPATRLQMIAVDDIGGMAAAAFEHPGKWQQRSLEIAGDELSMTALAEALGRAAGRGVEYRQTPWDEFEAQSGPEVTTMYRWFQDAGYSADIPAVRQEYPRLTAFDRWLNSNWHSATRTA
jgi:uncharacterized protein YbjT (DUF2867 family)